MAIPQNTELRVTVTFAMPGLTIAQNVYYAKYLDLTSLSDGLVSTDMEQWATNMMDTVEDDVNDGVTINSVKTAKAVAGTPVTWEAVGERFPTWVGLNLAEMLPNGVAAVVRVLSEVGKTVARKYIAGFTEAGSVETAWIASTLANMTLFLIAWFNGPSIPGREYEPGVWSTKTDSFVPLLTEGAISTIPGYQRRRKPGVGA